MHNVQDIPGPKKGNLIFGSALDFGKNPIKFLEDMVRTYGDFVRFYLMTEPIYLVNNPDTVHQILFTHADKFQKQALAKFMLKRFLGNGLIMNDGESWRRQRRLAQPSFHMKRIETYAQMIVGAATHMLSRWHDGQTLDVQDEMMAVTLRIIAQVLFRTEVEDKARQLGQAFNTLNELVIQRSRMPLPVPEWLPTPQNVRERLRALSQLVAGVAHELNTPLGIINTALSIITQRLNSDVFKTVSLDRKARSAWDDVLEAAQLAEGNIQRAHRLVQSFKNISVSWLTDSRENLDIVDALNETLTLFSINARRAHLALELRDDLGGHSHTWLGYRGYLSQVLLNLLTNVERYAYPDGAGGRVVISIGADDERAVRCYLIGVRDFGHGIAPEHLPKVFDPFFTTGRGSGGTGLGLAIVHNIVTSALKGTIAVESSLGQGTRFTPTVPQTIPDEIRTL
jgi:signal transduction histidine kinase